MKRELWTTWTYEDGFFTWALMVKTGRFPIQLILSAETGQNCLSVRKGLGLKCVKWSGHKFVIPKKKKKKRTYDKTKFGDTLIQISR